MNTGLAFAISHPSFGPAYAEILAGMDCGATRANIVSSTLACFARVSSETRMVRMSPSQAVALEGTRGVIAGDGVARRSAAVRDALIAAADELLDLAAECVPQCPRDSPLPIFNLSPLASAVLAPCGHSAGRPFP